MSETVYLGRCLCRSVRYEAHGAWRNLCHCHCESCRRAAGAPFVSWGTIDRDKFAVVHGALSIVRSSQDVERGFCGACGTTLTYAHARRDREIDVTLASLEDPSLVTPQAHIWVRDKLPWIEITDGLPQYSRVLGMDETP
jgi:hypothetical protein